MANFLSGFLDNLAGGLLTPKGNLADFQHAARLYNANSFRLAPKTKYLYHVVLNINPEAIKSTTFKQQHLTAVNLLVKNVDLPSFKVSVNAVHQYNRKKQVQTKLDYDPINIVFHDDNVGVTTQLWSLYYGYYFADSAHGGSAGSVPQTGTSGIGTVMGLASSAINSLVPGVSQLLGSTTGATGSASATVPAAYARNTYQGQERNNFRYGLDNNSALPFFTTIQIFQLSRHQYQSYTLINPIITAWQHEKLDQSDTNTPAANSMSIAYEAVIYGQGAISQGNPKGFATEFYDKSPSPLTLAGGGTTSLFGQGGVLGGIGDVLGNIGSGQAFSSPGAFLGTLIKGANVVRNAQKLTKAGITQEGYNLVKGAIGAATGVNVSGVANIIVPKSNGNGQNQTTKALGAFNANTSALSTQQVQKISSTPGALDSVSRQARTTGAVPSTASNADVSKLLSDGNNPKINAIARSLVTKL